MGRGPILKCQVLRPCGPRSPAFPSAPCGAVGLCGISTPFGMLSPSQGQVTHALRTRLPLAVKSSIPIRLAASKNFSPNSPLDLHASTTPPAFALSQDQTLHQKRGLIMDIVLTLSPKGKGSTGSNHPDCQRAKLGEDKTRVPKSAPLFSPPTFTGGAVTLPRRRYPKLSKAVKESFMVSPSAGLTRLRS